MATQPINDPFAVPTLTVRHAHLGGECPDPGPARAVRPDSGADLAPRQPTLKENPMPDTTVPGAPPVPEPEQPQPVQPEPVTPQPEPDEDKPDDRRDRPKR